MRRAPLSAAFLFGAAGLLGADEPDYPLGPLRFPDLLAPDTRVTLTDFHYRVSEQAEEVQTFGVRLRLGRFAVVGGEVNDQRKELSVRTHRLDLAYAENQGRHEIVAGFRAPWFRLRTDADRRAQGQGAGWLIDTEGALRLSPDLEILTGASFDTDPGAPRVARNRPIRTLTLGALYQRSPSFEASLTAVRTRLRTEVDGDQDTDHVEGRATVVVLGSQVDALGGWERTTGRLGRTEGFAQVFAIAPLRDRLLGQFLAATTWEPGIERFEEELRASLTLTARRFRLARAGEAGRRTEALVRRANEMGANLRRNHDLDGRRDVRERLALSPRREELREELEALYRAQVEERNVPLASLDVSHTFNHVRGTRGFGLRGSVAIPWPARWPWMHDEATVPFLRATYVQGRLRYDSGFTTINREVDLEVALNREMGLVLRWIRPGLQPLDVIREQGRVRVLELEFTYALGR